MLLHRTFLSTVPVNCYTWSMINISKRAVSKRVHIEMESQFNELFVFRLSKKEIATLFSEILTPTERTMLLKRVAAIGMLAYGHDVRAVARTLSISPTTAIKLKRNIKKQTYPTLWRIYRKIHTSIFDLLVYGRGGIGRFQAALMQKKPIKPRI